MSIEAGMRMNERLIRTDRTELATEAFGDAAHRAVLLFMGAMASMLWWPDEFCERLSYRGRHVVRYDNRDTGRSMTQKPGPPAYTLEDMADDAIRARRQASFVGLLAQSS